MAKRFTDTDKYKKPFIRSLPGAYKLFWDYLYHECDHAGIWIVDFEIAQIYLGGDMQVDRENALKLFNKDEQRVIEFSDGKKWFIKAFVDFQYGELNPDNRVHNSVINILKREKLYHPDKGLISPLQGCKDKDKDINKDKDKDRNFSKKEIEQIYQAYPRKVGKKKALQKIEKALREIDYDELIERVQLFSKCVEGKDKQYIPHPDTWFNQGRWEDDPDEWVAWKNENKESEMFDNHPLRGAYAD